jgi:RNA polymerase sigma factor (sigma-70 family)
MQKHRLFYDNLESLLTTDPAFCKNMVSEAEHDAVLWNALRSGSRHAFDSIFKLYAARLYSYGSKFTKDQNLVLDCIQDLFVELWNRRLNLSETDSIRFYLLKALRRRIARALNAARRFQGIEEDFRYLEEKVNFSAEHFLVIHESEQLRHARLSRSIEQLTKRQRESIYLKFFQGLNNQAIAAVMGLSENSVYTLVSQAVKALRSSLA